MRYTARFVGFVTLSVATTGCSKKTTSEQTPDASSSSATTSASPGALVTTPLDASASHPACRPVHAYSEQRIAGAPRQDTGLTLTKVQKNQIGVGYIELGDPMQRNTALSVLGSPTYTEPTLPVDPAKDPLPPRARVISRLTVVDEKGATTTDFTEDRPNGIRNVRCGGGDDRVPALVAFSGVSAYREGAVDGGAGDAGTAATTEIRDCRSFALDGATWALAFEATQHDADPVEMRWLLRAPGVDDAHSLIAHTTLPKTEPNASHPSIAALDRWGYTRFASTKIDGAYALAARQNGRLLYARVGADGTKAFDVQEFWLGTATNTPWIAARNGRVILLTTLAGKPEIYGTTFAADEKPTAPKALPIPPAGDPGDPNERSNVNAAITSDGHVVVVFLEGKPGKRRLRVAWLDRDLNLLLPLYTPGDDEHDVADAKVALYDGDEILVVGMTGDVSGGYWMPQWLFTCK